LPGLAKLLLPIDGELDPKAMDHHDQEQEVETFDHLNLPDTPAGGIPGRRFHKIKTKDKENPQN